MKHTNKTFLTLLLIVFVTSSISVYTGSAASSQNTYEEKEIKRRITLDYSLDQKQLYSSLKSSLKNFTSAEFETWQKEGRFDFIVLNGKKLFMNSSKSNLFFRYPELKKRKIGYTKYDAFSREVLKTIRTIKASTPNKNGVVLLPKKAVFTQSLTLKSGTVQSGELLRSWLPYPIVFDRQNNVTFINSNHPVKSIDKGDSVSRSAYFETKTTSPTTKFELKYSFNSFAYYQKINTANIMRYNTNDINYKKYTLSGPHIVFSPKMVAQAKTIVENQTNPYIKAKKIYDWIGNNIKYSYALEYSTIKNISEYTLQNKYGDCGQASLLFITLCRISGVPARFQSGFLTFPHKQISHDWAEIYVEPYGWIPVDPYMAIYFKSVTEDLSVAERKEISEFYFGNIDYYRMVANKDHSTVLVPQKKFIRSDDVDFQRGEIESNKKNIYFNERTYNFKVK